MFENPRRGRQARNFTTNAPKIPDLRSSSEQIFSRKLPLGAPGTQRPVKHDYLYRCPVAHGNFLPKSAKCPKKSSSIYVSTRFSRNVLWLVIRNNHCFPFISDTTTVISIVLLSPLQFHCFEILLHSTSHRPCCDPQSTIDRSYRSERKFGKTIEL